MNNVNEKTYAKPELISLGSAQELTQSVNVIGTGDNSFTVLDS